MALKWPAKDPDETLDYTLRWFNELDRLSDTIATSSWRIEGADSALVIDSSAFSAPDHLAHVWLTAGTEGVKYNVINTITTTGGRTYERTVQLQVKER